MQSFITQYVYWEVLGSEHQELYNHCSDRAKVEVKAEPERREWDGRAWLNLVESLKCC